MAGFGVTVTGLQRIQARIANLRSDVEEVLAEEIESAAENIANMAKQAAPSVIAAAGKDEIDEPGQIRNSLQAWKSGPLEWSVGMPRLGRINDMAGYLEFGTGIYVDIIPGLEAYAMMWFVNGRGTILPHPYLFPSAEREKPEFIARLKKDLGIA